MKGGGIGKAKAGAASGNAQWIPQPDAVNTEDYYFSHYYELYSGNISYDDWYINTDPCTVIPNIPYYTEEYVTQFMQQWIPPILIIFGLVTNTISAIKMVQLADRCLTSYLYFALIALVDSLVLISRSTSHWLRSVTMVDFTDWLLLQNDASCVFFTFFTSFLYHINNWLVVLPVAEMAVICKDFSKVHKICTRSRVKFSILLTVLIFVVINAHFFFTFTLLPSYWDQLCRKPQCTFTPVGWGHTFRDWLWPIVGDNIFANFGPLVTIGLCVLYIILKPAFHGQKKNCQLQSVGENHFIMDTHSVLCFRRICIVLSFFFIITSIPEAFYNMYEFILEKNENNEFTEPVSFARRSLVGTVSSILRDVFLSTKILVYYICWGKFRSHLYGSVPCGSVRNWCTRHTNSTDFIGTTYGKGKQTEIKMKTTSSGISQIEGAESTLIADTTLSNV